MATATPPVRDRPAVLLVLQGGHHLDLFDAVLAQCPAFDWVCLVHGIADVPRIRLDALHDRYGVRFFTDVTTAMLHFGDLDAVVTTFALPHLAHLPYLGLIALANDLGLPVFELQHGLFQTGLSLHADGALAGSGMAGAQSGQPVRNLTDAVLSWWGTGAVGYPPFHPAWRGALDEAGTEPFADPRPLVAVFTNLHWTLLSTTQSRHGYGLVRAAILALPDVRFALAPHPTERSGAGFALLLSDLDREGAANVTVCAAADRAGRARLFRDAAVALATPSTMLLDLEMRAIPTLLLGLPPFEGLYASLDRACVVRDADALVAAIAAAVDATAPAPALRTGRLQPFDAAALQARITAALPPCDTPPRPARDTLPVIYRHALAAGRP